MNKVIKEVAGEMQRGELVQLARIHAHYSGTGSESKDGDRTRRWAFVEKLPNVRPTEHPAQTLCPARWLSEDSQSFEPMALESQVRAFLLEPVWPRGENERREAMRLAVRM